MNINLDVLLVVIDAVFAIWCAYNAGKLKVVMDSDEHRGRPLDRVAFGLWVIDLAAAVYFIVAIYGHGIARGGA